MRLDFLLRQILEVSRGKRANESRLPIDCARLENRVVFSGSPIGDASDIDIDTDPTDAHFELDSQLDEPFQQRLGHIDRLVGVVQDAQREIDEESLVEAGLVSEENATDFWVRGGDVAALNGPHTLTGTGEIQANQNSPLDVGLNEATSNTSRGGDAAVGIDRKSVV